MQQSTLFSCCKHLKKQENWLLFFRTFRLLMVCLVMIPVLPDSKAIGDMLLRERSLVCFHIHIPSSCFYQQCPYPPTAHTGIDLNSSYISVPCAQLFASFPQLQVISLVLPLCFLIGCSFHYLKYSFKVIFFFFFQIQQCYFACWH